MKLSLNLPKISYTTTIGDISITNISNYYELADIPIDTTIIPIDKNTTLIEKSASTYDSTNGFWLFLFANKAINPFTLLKTSTTSQISTYDSNDTINIKYGGSDVTQITAGSIITNFLIPSGSAWNPSATGYFDLNGSYAVVDSVNSFTKVLTLKTPIGTVIYADATNMTAIINGDTYYQLNTPTNYYSITSNNYQKQSDLTKSISYTIQINTTGESFLAASDPDVSYLQLDSDLPPVKKGSEPYAPAGTEDPIDHSYFAQNQNIDIIAYLPNKFGYKNLNKVIQKYD
jgi:hypothetical protein